MERCSMCRCKIFLSVSCQQYARFRLLFQDKMVGHPDSGPVDTWARRSLSILANVPNYQFKLSRARGMQQMIAMRQGAELTSS